MPHTTRVRSTVNPRNLVLKLLRNRQGASDTTPQIIVLKLRECSKLVNQKKMYLRTLILKNILLILGNDKNAT